MKTKQLRLLLALLLAAPCLWAQTAQPTTDANRKKVVAMRVERAPRVDGALDDECWKNASPATDFITNTPVFGQPSAEQTEVRIVYTDEAIYFGAFMFMQDASKLRTDLSARDAQTSADQLHIGLDTYLDRQNAFRFQISASGVQSDIRMSPTNYDQSWDAVWEGHVKRHANGWSAEIRVPFSAIRFSKKSEQTWGLQIARQIQHLNEFSTWSPVDPNGGGVMTQWGNLEGLRDLDPPLRLSFSPYLAGSVQRSPLQSEKPTDYTTTRTVNGGLDLKWGINESFTLDATLVPNFGEAQSDNRVRNLSPFEVPYEERRQFFTEGTELFSKGGTFYSRRIGGSPRGLFDVYNAVGPDEIVAKNPAQQQLFNATKLSGRTKSKLGIGLLNAIAGPARATLRDTLTGEERKFQTAELANYNVFVLDQALPNNSAISFVNTSLVRNGVARDANVSALQFNLRDRANKYEIFGDGKWSMVFNPDDATQKKPQTGGGGTLGVGQVSGKYSWTLLATALNDTYDQRDMGFGIRNNYFRQFARLSRSNYEAHGKWLYTYWEASAENTMLAKSRAAGGGFGEWEALEMFSYMEGMTRQQLTLGMVAVSRPIWYYDYFEPRIWGKQYHHAPWIFVEPNLTTDNRKKLRARFSLTFGESPIPRDPYIGCRIAPTWTVNDHLILRGNFRISKDHSNFGAANWWDTPGDVIFGRRDITTFDNEIGCDYLFTPRMSLTARARHYWAKLLYHQYLHLLDDGSFVPADDWQGSADENFNLFNVDFVYTWQFAPGSFLNVIWKDAIFQGDQRRADEYLQNFRKTLRTPQDNTLTIKLIYYLDAGGW